MGRLTKEAESGATDALTLSYTYGRDNNRETMTVSGAESYAVGYAYDDINRLLSTEKTSGGEVETTHYRYDKNGNQISKLTETLSPAGSSSPGLSLTNGVVPGFEAFAYDGFNRLISANIGGIDTVYTYRPDGLRHSKATSGVTTTHIWDGSNISLDIVGSGVTKYIRGINLIASESSGTRQYYLYNAHGDVVQLTNSSGVVTKNYDYDAFGNERNPDESFINPWRYCGEYFDTETGTVYLRARMYDPRIGRFTTEDPIGAGLNWYTYCGGNPVMFIDPTGLIDVMLEYIAKKNEGIADYLKKGGGCSRKQESVTVTINGITKTYTIGEKDSSVRFVNKMLIIDNEILMNDFGLTEDQTLHLEGDLFDSADHTAMAFGMMYHQRSIDERQEYGAVIDKDSDGKFSFSSVMNSTTTAALLGKTIDPKSADNDPLRNQVVHISNVNTVGFIHTHWRSDGNLNFSNPSDYHNDSSLSYLYLINRNGQVYGSERSTKKGNINGWALGKKKFKIK